MGIELCVHREKKYTREECMAELKNIESYVFFGDDAEQRKQQLVDKLLSGNYGVYYPVDLNGNFSHLNPLRKEVDKIDKLLVDQMRPDWSDLYEKKKAIEANFRNDLGHYAYGSMDVLTSEVPLLNKWFGDGYSLSVNMDSVNEFRQDLEMAAAIIKERREDNTTVVPYSEEKTPGGMTLIQSGYDSERLLEMLRSFYRGTNLLIKFSKKFPGEHFVFSAH